MRRRDARALTSVVAAALLVTLAPVTTPALAASGSSLVGASHSTATTRAIRAASMGINLDRIAYEGVVPPGTGAVRIFVGVRWALIEPRRGARDWFRLDRAVAAARAAGVRDILYVLGSTPSWAARTKRATDTFGPGTASHPKRDSYYLSYLRAVVRRYKGVITSYELWNEPNLSSFYQGSPRELARLSRAAYRLIHKLDPSARVVSPSWVLETNTPGRDRQLAAMRNAGWPFDVVSMHAYPWVTRGPREANRLITGFRRQLAALGIARKPLWNTEMNFGNRRPGLPRRVHDGASGASLLARAYVDGLRLGVARTYWYSWEAQILGVLMTDGEGRVTPAGRAFTVLSTWLVGARWGGCRVRAGVVRCAIPTRTGQRRTLVYATGRARRIDMPSGTRQMCVLDGRCRSVEAGKPLRVTGATVLLVGPTPARSRS